MFVQNNEHFCGWRRGLVDGLPLGARILIFGLTGWLVFGAESGADVVTAKWEYAAEAIYDSGFMSDLRKLPDGGVGLFDMNLVENDAPGAGKSEKGISCEPIFGEIQGRKILRLTDRRARAVFLVLFLDLKRMPDYPLRFLINGRALALEPWDLATCHLHYRWLEFPAEWLAEGDNIIEFFCPEAVTPQEGWNVCLARADEFEEGGGNPAEVGKTSWRSVDSGKSWVESQFGPDGRTRAEYSIRLSLDRHVAGGWLATPVIDIWRAQDDEWIMPIRLSQKLKMHARAAVPEETSVEYYARWGSNPGPFDAGWSEYAKVGSGAEVTVELGTAAIRGRFLQVKAVLATQNPLRTPRLELLRVETELQQIARNPAGLRLVGLENPAIRYSALEWQWENSARPEFAQLRARENLDGVTAGCRTQFELIARLLEYATFRAPSRSPQYDYPGWDALSILDAMQMRGGMGFCLHYNNFLNGCCMAYGLNGRLVNGNNHEMAEVWSDDFGKWVYLDASGANHCLVDPKTGAPMSLLDLHRIYLDYFFADRPIDWMRDMVDARHQARRIKERKDKPSVLRSSSTWHDSEAHAFKGFLHSAFLRVIPRNNFYEKPLPMPLAHGTSSWPWDGYVNWYDARTPPKKQYSRFTDRPADIWPDLNLTRLHATAGRSGKFLHLQMETYTPNFSHFEVNENDGAWRSLEGNQWTWVLAPGMNSLHVRAVNCAGLHGRSALALVNRIDLPIAGQ